MTFILTSIFMLMVFWRPQEWLVPWMFGWPIMDVIVCAAVVSLFLENERGQIRIPWRMPQIWLFAGLWVSAVMSHVAHFYFKGMMETIPIVFKFCFFNALLFSVLDRCERVRMVAILWVTMACVMSVHAIMQDQLGHGFAGQRPLWIRANIYRPGYSRSLFFGIFGDPNDMAQFLATSIPFAFAIFWKRSFLRFVASCSIAALIVAALLTTHSRGGMVALAMVVGVMGALLFPLKWLPWVLGGVIVGGLGLCTLAEPYMDTSAYERVVFWGLANRMFKQNIMFGIGFNMFWMVARDRAVHNAFVGCYTTLGLFGYWFWFCLLQLGVVGAWRARTAMASPATMEEAWLRRFSGLSIAAMGGFCASAYFLSRAFVYPMFFLMVLLGSLSVVAQNMLPDNWPRLIRPQWDLFVVGTLGTVGSITYIYFSIILLNKAVGGGGF